MRFQKKINTQKVMSILETNLNGTSDQLKQATKEIVNMLKIEHDQKLKLKEQRDDALIKADNTDVWYF